MSTLLDLLKAKNDFLSLKEEINLEDKIKNIISLLESNNSNISLNKVIESYKMLSADYQKVSSSIEATSADIDSLINDYLYNLSKDEKYLMLDEAKIFNYMRINDQIESHISSKITHYSNWHYPTLQINPREKRWIDYMVAGDPLYLTSHFLYSVRNLISPYPSLYQSRLRLYEIQDRNFAQLPQAQFGFVFCWDNFEYLSFEKIEQYIRSVFKLLRPGGTFIFSYNNCDILESAVRFENFSAGWCTTKLLSDLFNEIGYEMIEFNDIKNDDEFSPYVSWVEIRKPGILTTLKGHQALAQIIPK